jgi:hypothetical protein
VFTIALLSLISIATASAPHAQSAGVKRTVLMRRDHGARLRSGVDRGRNSAGGREMAATRIPNAVGSRRTGHGRRLDYDGKSTAHKAESRSSWTPARSTKA